MTMLCLVTLLLVPPVQDQKLATVPEGIEVAEIYFSSDGKGVAYRGKKEGKEFVFVRDQRGEEFDAAYLYGLISDGRPVYSAWNRAAGKNVLVVGTKKGEPLDSVHEAAWSGDGKVVAFVASVNYEDFVVTGERRGPVFKDVGRPVVSADGKVVAYRAEREWKRLCIVINDRPGEEYEDVSHPIIGPDGLVAYVAHKGEKRFVVLDGKKGEEFGSIAELLFRSDGTLAYLARDGGKTFLVIGGKKEREFDAAEGYPMLAPEGREVAWVLNEGKWDRAYVLFRGKKGEEFNQVSSVTISPDGTHVTYVGMKHQNFENQRHFLVVDDRKGDDFDGVACPVFSVDGSAVACIVQKGERQRVLVGSKFSEEFDWVAVPTFSPDGKHVLFGARKGRELWRKSLSVR